MTASGPAALPATYTPSVPSATLLAVGHDGMHQNIQDEERAIWTALGLTAGANDLLGYVRLHDGTSKGLLVPLAALVSDPMTINGNFDHWQRMAATVRTSTTTWNRDTSFAADRIYVLPAGASITQQRSTTVPDARSQYSLQINGATSVTTVDVGTRLTGRIINTRGLQSQVFSCYVRNESGSAYTPNLRIGTPATLDTFATVTNRLDQALQSCPDSAWTRVHHVFDPTAYTNIANGMQVDLRIPSGFSVAGDVNRIAQFDLRPGTQFRGYLPPDPDTELDLCRGTYWKSYDRDVVPGAVTAVSEFFQYVDQLTSLANRTWSIAVRFPVQMWIIPTMTAYDAAGTSGKVTMTGGSMNAIISGTGMNGCRIGGTDTGTNAVAVCEFQVTSNAELV